jgi:hypothetical protein
VKRSRRSWKTRFGLESLESRNAPSAAWHAAIAFHPSVVAHQNQSAAVHPQAAAPVGGLPIEPFYGGGGAAPVGYTGTGPTNHLVM